MSTESKSETPRTYMCWICKRQTTGVPAHSFTSPLSGLFDYCHDCWSRGSQDILFENKFKELHELNERLEKELNEANEKLEQKDNEKDEEWLSAIAKAWNFQFGKPYETKDTTEANVVQIFQEIENLIAAHNDHVKEIEEITEAISKFRYQDGTLVSMCERFKAYCDSQTRHLKEDTTAAVAAVTQLAKENKRMREALKQFAQPFIHNTDAIDYINQMEEIAVETLKSSSVTNLIVLTRDELIAEIEKMPCTCHTRFCLCPKCTVSKFVCERCQWASNVKGQSK